MNTLKHLPSGQQITIEESKTKYAEELHEMQIHVLGLIDQARKSIEKLNDIALRPIQLSMDDYIDILINNEMAEGGHGWEERVQQLKGVKGKADHANSSSIK